MLIILKWSLAGGGTLSVMASSIESVDFKVYIQVFWSKWGIFLPEVYDSWKTGVCTVHLQKQLLENQDLYSTLGCDIKGFLTMRLSVQYWPRWFQDFPAIWLAGPFGANEAHLGICTLPEKKQFFLCEISGFGVSKVFPKENSPYEVFMVTNCPYAAINKWMEKSNNFF